MDLIKIILAAISPTLRKLIVQFILSLRKHAEGTDNPLDDVIVEVIIKLFDIKD